MAKKQQQAEQQDVKEASGQIATDCEQLSDACDLIIEKVKKRKRQKVKNV